MKEFPDTSELIKSFTREKTFSFPVIKGEKGSVFKYLMREYVFKFALVQNGQTSSYYAGKVVNLLLKRA